MAIASFDADIDAVMEGINGPNVNYGSGDAITSGILYIGGDKAALWHAIGNFNVSSLAGETINSAKLVREISFVSGTGAAARLSRCTRPSTWTEDGVTWNKYDGTNAWTAAGGDYDDTGPPAKIDYTEPGGTGEHEILGLKDFVEDALDNRGGIVSIIIRLQDEAPETTHYNQWRSKEYGSDIWRLVVDYAAGGLPERGFLRGVQRGVMRGG